MNLPIGQIIDGVANITDELFTSEEERRALQLKDKELDNSILLGQMAVNKEEAKHKSIFVAGWRPFIGWVGGAALAYQFVLYPLLLWVWSIGKSGGWIALNIEAPPVLDTSALLTVVMGMLGIGVMRSYDKKQGTDTPSINEMSRREIRIRKRLQKLEEKKQ